MDYVALGAAIRKRRTELGWKIAKLADEVNVTEDFIGKIERATDIPSIQTVVSIANALGVGVDYLLDNDLHAVDYYLCSELNELIGDMEPRRRKAFLQFIRHNYPLYNKLDLNFKEE